MDAHRQRGLLRGHKEVPRCRICAWAPKVRRRLIKRHLEGATLRTLEREFDASRSLISIHFRTCVPGEIARAGQERHVALDWNGMLDDLHRASESAATAVRNAAARGDIAALLAAMEAVTEGVRQRIDLADRVRRLEHDELCDALAAIAGAFVLTSPTKGPAVIAKILATRPAAASYLAALEEDDDASRN